jgi:divalent metal cation (Fe/Co/Zn/Cd) transporter
MRTVVPLLVVAVLGYVGFKLVFGIAGPLLGLLISLVLFLVKVALVAGLVYWLLTVFSPETAKKVRDAVRGPTSL